MDHTNRVQFVGVLVKKILQLLESIRGLLETEGLGEGGGNALDERARQRPLEIRATADEEDLNNEAAIAEHVETVGVALEAEDDIVVRNVGAFR